MRRDEAWFDEVFERHHRAVEAYCVRRVGVTDAPDLVSQVFAVAWRRRHDVPPDDRVRPWLYGVARRVVGHQWRSRRRACRLAAKAGMLRQLPRPDPEEIVLGRDEHEMVRQAVARLSPTDREVLLLSAWEGLTHAQIADALGRSRAAIEKRFVRAKIRLADEYESLARDGARGALAEPATPGATQSPARAPKGGGSP